MEAEQFLAVGLGVLRVTAEQGTCTAKSWSLARALSCAWLLHSRWRHRHRRRQEGVEKAENPDIWFIRFHTAFRRRVRRCLRVFWQANPRALLPPANGDATVAP